MGNEQTKLQELAKLIAERDKIARKVSAIDKKIAEIVGLGDKNNTHKMPGQTLNKASFLRACGM